MDTLHRWLHTTIDKCTVWCAAVFIIFGTGVLVATLANYWQTPATANVVDSVLVTPHYKQTDTSHTVKSTLHFTSEIPVTTNTAFTVEAEGRAVHNVRLSVQGLSNLNSISLFPQSTQSDNYSFAVPIQYLKSGDYQLELSARSAAGDKIITRGPQVTIEHRTQVPPDVPTTAEEPLPADSTHRQDDEPLSVSISFPSNELAQGEISIAIRPSRPVQEVDVYAKAEHRTTELFLGAARALDSREWIATIDTTDLPNGLYRLYAQATAQDVTVQSVSQFLAIQNPRRTTNTEQPADRTASSDAIAAEERPKTREPASVTVRQSPADREPAADIRVPTAPTRTSQSPIATSVQLTNSFELVVRRVLQENQIDINQTITRYVAAADIATLQATSSIAELTDTIVFEILQDRRLRNISNEAKHFIDREIHRLTHRGVQLELTLRDIRTTDDNPTEAIETLLKAVEIPESSVADITSPRDFGLVRDDVFSIDTVAPLIVTDQISSTTRVFTEITGRAIPRSQVTLFIYSSPVMVTITAAADGTFSYVYEKELADGDHEVYVALTNTNGAVVAKSNGFRFIKEAQAFTLVDDASGDSLVPLSTSSPSLASDYTTVLAVSIIGLGLLLLLLNTRTRRTTTIGQVTT